MKPLVSYYGGKQKMASKIVPLLPKHTVYVEPFAGGAAVFFAKPWPPVSNNNNYREVINDIDSRLVNLYRVVADHDLGPRFVQEAALPYSREVHKWSQENLDAGGIRGAVAYWHNIQCSFTNKLNAGWGTSVFGGNHAVTWASKVAGLPAYLDRMHGVYIENDDALAVIRRWDSPQTLFYCDPPYPGTEQGHYGGYSLEDFSRLCDALDNCQGSFVLSNYDNPGPRANWERFEFTSHVSSKGIVGEGRDKTKASTVRNDCQRTEIVWRVDRSANARPEIQDIWNRWNRARRAAIQLSAARSVRVVDR